MTTPTFKIDADNRPGPRQMKALEKACRNLQALSSTYFEDVGGVRMEMFVPFSERDYSNGATRQAFDDVIARFPIVTKRNARDVTAALVAEHDRIRPSLPVL